jgi:DNA repair photolyase
MNVNHSLSERVQYDYLRLSIRPRKRFSKWLKNEKPDDIEVVKRYYNYSNRKAEEALRVLSDEDIENMKQEMYEGGSKTKSST